MRADEAAKAREVRAAFRTCRQIARREAKNFYYAFVALPRLKSDAMCAMYAFMRRADDIADDETMPVEDRRALMERWLAAFHAGDAVSGQDGQVFVAVRETQRRFGIADALLDELVAGTAMDLAAVRPEGLDRMEVGGRSFDAYRTVEALDRYCYLVASVVGLVTIRIFGFRDERANGYAVDLGKAFQYTNILRDVREDAERGRIYLPGEVLAAHGAEAADVAGAATGKITGKITGKMPAGVRDTMAAMADRAEGFYGAGRLLIPLLDRDSRAAMRVLLAIYHALLRKIRARDFAVLGGRVRVSTPRKVGILLKGLLGSLAGRFG